MFEINILAAAFLFAFLIILIQAFITLAYTYKTKIGKNWLVLSLLINLWVFVAWRVNAYPDNLSLIFFIIYNLTIILIPVFYFRFLLNFLGLIKIKKVEFRFIYSTSFILLLFNLLYISKQKIVRSFYPLNSWEHLDIIQMLSLSFFSFIFLYSFYLMIIDYNNHHDIKKRKIKYLFIGAFFAFLGGAVVYLPIINQYAFIGVFLIIIAVLIHTYVLLKHPLAGIREMMSYLYIYIFIACFLYIAHQVMVFIGESYLGGVWSSKSLGLGIIESIIFSVVLLSFLRSVRRSSDVLFYKGRKPGDAIKDLAIKINKEVDFESLFRIIKKEFKNIIGTENVKIIILESLEKNKVLSEYSSVGINYPTNSQIFKIRNLIVNKNNKEKTNVRRELDKYGFKVAIPLLLEDKLRGIIFLGGKHMDYEYNEEDLNFLRIIGSHVAIAIHNALLCEQLGECNLELENELKEKIKGINEKNERLKKVLKSQSQFLDIASHQLRTPMSVIKGMLSMIQEKRLSQKKKDEFLISIYQNALRLEDIIETILTASELDSGSFGFELEPVQLKPLLLAIEEKEKVRAKKKNIKFRVEIPQKYLLPVLSNGTYLKQIIDSLVDNAFQYTQEGEIIVKLISYKDRIDIDVIDTGIGISNKEKEDIFDKFCRGKNAIDTYGNGSGLGLYVAKKIIDGYHKDAKIFVKKSVLGKGSTFSVSLPIVKNV